MEQLNNLIYGNECLSKIIDKARDWNFETLDGIGCCRKHDKYALIELKLYHIDNHPEKDKLKFDYYYSYFNWNVDPNQFPIENYEYAKQELIKYAEFITNWFCTIKGKRIPLVYEINFAGCFPADVFGRGAAGRALLDAIVSCFDEDLYKIGIEKKKKNHPSTY
ncbi:MAG: hypothetical protein J7574_15970 [Flavobacterium sp.]|uniref:hypothetical protein n=1 Tax=Flavobacterium sp. TaxID=239 RepID=UPI001B1C104F|nr:hypothetical protein [Flavobacterium sp.]MBO9585663.1 hypothetical protein [Flavobacterium sp.]